MEFKGGVDDDGKPLPHIITYRAKWDPYSRDHHAVEGKCPVENLAPELVKRIEATALARSQAERLHAAVRSAANEAGADDRTAVAALQDHWWVERLEGGQWIAMDVLLPDAKPGDALTTASSTSEWKASDGDPAIPESEWHTVRVRVVVERYENGATSESTALETTLRPAEVLDQPITLRHLPDPWPESLPDPKTDPNALGNTAVNVRRWLPFLQVGEKSGGDPRLHHRRDHRVLGRFDQWR